MSYCIDIDRFKAKEEIVIVTIKLFLLNEVKYETRLTARFGAFVKAVREVNLFFLRVQ